MRSRRLQGLQWTMASCGRAQQHEESGKDDIGAFKPAVAPLAGIAGAAPVAVSCTR